MVDIRIIDSEPALILEEEKKNDSDLKSKVENHWKT